MGSITLGPDISCSIWVDVGDLYYMMDKDTKSTSDSKYTCFVSFVPLGGGAAAAYCVDKVCPSYRLPISFGFGLWAWSWSGIVWLIGRMTSHAFSGLIIRRTSDRLSHNRIWFDSGATVLSFVIVWDWINWFNVKPVINQLNVRLPLQPNQLRGGKTPWLYMKVWPICSSLQGRLNRS